LAVVYVRTARDDQQAAVAQRALASRARKLGWPSKRIKIIEDLGRSAYSEHRAGYQQLMAMIRARAVGLVLVRDVSRLSRNPVELEVFLLRAQRAGALVYAQQA
jgi:DNA invertase Pin-like site-specific DNA recombinase